MTTAAHRSASSRSEMLVTGEFAFSAANFREIADLVKAESGIDLAESKATLVYSRLAKRLRALGIPTFSDYCDAVRDDAARAQQHDRRADDERDPLFQRAASLRASAKNDP